MKLNAIRPARLDFNDEGTPVSRDFDDVYFSNDNGLEETRHVFLKGNRLTQRFSEHPRPLMVVAESGFGTGLNFLTLWQAFDAFCTAQPDAALQRLHFISFEKFPLTHSDLVHSHARWPELARYAHALQAQWPLPFGGCHRLLLDNGRVTLDLWFGDIAALTDALDDSLNGKVDAWFLDGFSPAKNPEMWTSALFNAMARLAHPDSTLATFTAAGFVRRGLQDAGFMMEKRPGFGRKREMLVGQRTAARTPAPRTPWYARGAATGKREAAVIGGGVASAMLALALLRRGWRVTLYCKDKAPAEGASGNRQGALYPLLSQHDAALAAFFPAAFTFARRLYDRLPVVFDHAWCGVTQLGWNEKSRRKITQMLDLPLPDDIAHAVSAEDIAVLCGVATGHGGVTYPLGGWLCPAELTAAAIDYAVTLGLSIRYGQPVERLTPCDDGWQLEFADGHRTIHTAVALANGHDIQGFSQTRTLPVYPVEGQVSHIPSTPGLGALRQVLCYDGYLTPVNPKTQQHCIGASYHRGQTCAAFSADDQLDNRQRLINCLPDAAWTRDVNVSANKARCGVRCATRDHLPMVGGVPDYDATLSAYARLSEESDMQAQQPAPVYSNLFMLGALGSRGLCSAPLAAEILAAQMSDEPLPLDAATLAALNPNRLWVRKLLKGKAVKSA